MKVVIRYRSPLNENATRTTWSRRIAKPDRQQTGQLLARSVARIPFQTISKAAYPRRFACTDIHHTPKSVRVIVSQNHEHKGEKPVAVYCFTQLIQPGKREEAKAIFEEILETRRSEY